MSKYCDLAQMGDGHAGTTVDPYSWADVLASQPGEDTFFLKGKAVIDTWLSNLHEVNMSAWDASLYGPPRLQLALDQSQANVKGIWDGFIIEVLSMGTGILLLNDNLVMTDCFIHSLADSTCAIDIHNCTFKGCTIIGEGTVEGINISVLNNHTVTAVDTLFQAVSWKTDAPW